MPPSIRSYVEEFTLEAIKEVMSDYEKLEEVGSIGDCKLRTIAEELSSCLPSPPPLEVYMNSIAMECFRVLAYRYLKTIQS